MRMKGTDESEEGLSQAMRGRKGSGNETKEGHRADIYERYC